MIVEIVSTFMAYFETLTCGKIDLDIFQPLRPK